jgi:hypothetical protein
MEVLMGKSSTNGPFSMAMLNNQMLHVFPLWSKKPPRVTHTDVMVPEGTDCSEEWLLLVDGVQLRLRVTAGALEDRTVT